MAIKFTTEHTYKGITFDEVVDFLEKNGTIEDKKKFKEMCYTKKDGTKAKSLNWLRGKKWFCEQFAPELIPVAKTKEPLKSERILNW